MARIPEMGKKEDKKGWDPILFYPRSGLSLSGHFMLQSNEKEHFIHYEEQQLHEHRNHIKTFDESLTNGKNWEYYKKVVNPYELVYTQRKYEHFPESICALRPLSRSYFKMIEMLDLLLFSRSTTMETAHVCEGPGGFIEALHEEAHHHNIMIHQSVAMTLKSKQHNIPGWKRATAFLKRNRNVKIIYGEDQTGDIMKPENQQYFIDYTTPKSIDLFTADGGFDFSCDYMKQEQMVFPLLLASTKIGFEVLKKGGVFILKIFDFYHKSTTDLLYFLSYHFDEWTLYKPRMSRPCNPEHYFIGKGFIGCSEEVLDVMRLWTILLEQHMPLDSLFTIDYPEEFTKIMESLRKKSYDLQCSYLSIVFDMIRLNQEEQIKAHVKKNEQISYEWCVRFNMPIYEWRRMLIVEEVHSISF